MSAEQTLVTGDLLSMLGRLYTIFLQTHHGFTCGIGDMLLVASAEKFRKKQNKISAEEGTKATEKWAEIKQDGKVS